MLYTQVMTLIPITILLKLEGLVTPWILFLMESSQPSCVCCSFSFLWLHAFTYFLLIWLKISYFQWGIVSHWPFKSESLGFSQSSIQIISGAYSPMGQLQLCNTSRHYVSYTLKILTFLYITDRFHTQSQRFRSDSGTLAFQWTVPEINLLCPDLKQRPMLSISFMHP